MGYSGAMRWGAVALMLCACHDFDATYQRCVAEGRCRDDAGADAATACETSDISGVAIVYRVLDVGEGRRPARGLTAHAQGCDGGWQTFAADVADSGAFVIAGVPRGERYLAFEETVVHTSLDQLTLDFWSFGRPDAAPCTRGTRISATLTNLSRWTKGFVENDLYLVSKGAGVWNLSAGTEGWFANEPNDGDLALNAATFGYCERQPRRLIDASKGDVALVTEASLGPGYWSVDRVFVANALTVPPGGVGAIGGGAFITVPQSEEAAFTYDTPSFELPYMAPDDGIPFVLHSVGVTPMPSGMPPWTPRLHLNDLAFTFIGKAAGPQAKDLLYGHPFGAGWSESFEANVNYRLDYGLPDGGTGNVLVSSGKVLPVAAVAPAMDAGVSAELGPVRNIRVNGMNAYGGLADAGLTPTVSWDPPSPLGAPTSYVVSLIPVLPPMGSAAGADIYTRDTRVRVPAGFLRADTTWVIKISALMDAAADAGRPLAISTPLSVSQNCTGLVTP